MNPITHNGSDRKLNVYEHVQRYEEFQEVVDRTEVEAELLESLGVGDE